MFIFEIVLIKFAFSFDTDDDHRIVLKSISGGVDCEHDYINAAYIDVSFLKMFVKLKNSNINPPAHNYI